MNEMEVSNPIVESITILDWVKLEIMNWLVSVENVCFKKNNVVRSYAFGLSLFTRVGK